MSLLELVNLHKTFEKGTVNENHVLRGLDLTIDSLNDYTQYGTCHCLW
ncbi:TPA: hypothetical protein ACGNVC_002044 [Streptococcus agalactiae]